MSRTIGLRIKEARKYKGIHSAYELAVRLQEQYRPEDSKDIFKSSVHSWECGRQDPSAESLIMLSKVLDCDPGFLLGLQDYPRSTIKVAADQIGIDYEQIQALSELKGTSQILLNHLLSSSVLDDFLSGLFHWCSQVPIPKGVNSFDTIDRAVYHRIMREFEEGLNHSGCIDMLLEDIMSARIEGKLMLHKENPENYFAK